MPRSFLFAVALAAAGCGPATEDITAVAETVIVGPEYTTKGLYVPDDTRRSLGLKVVEITEEKVAATTDLTLRVYAVTPAGARASVLVSPAEAVRLQAGQALELTSPAAASTSATITAVSDGLRSVAGHIEVLVEIVTDQPPAVGEFLAAKAINGGTEVVTSVPRSALIRGVEGYFVYTTSGDRFVRTPVVVGALTEQTAAIREGLYSGDEVVAEPAMSLWLTELAAIKGGHACCAVPARGK